MFFRVSLAIEYRTLNFTYGSLVDASENILEIVQHLG